MTQGGGLQQSSTAEDATQQQIPNIAGTITDTTTTSHKQIHQNHHHHHPHHAQQYLNGGVHLHQHLPQLHPYSSSVTGGSTGLLTANNGPVSGGAGAGGGGGGSAPSTLTSGAKLPAKTSPIGPSPFRQLLPVALCIISFATVLSILIIYMDTTGRCLYGVIEGRNSSHSWANVPGKKLQLITIQNIVVLCFDIKLANHSNTKFQTLKGFLHTYYSVNGNYIDFFFLLKGINLYSESFNRPKTIDYFKCNGNCTLPYHYSSLHTFRHKCIAFVFTLAFYRA